MNKIANAIATALAATFCAAVVSAANVPPSEAGNAPAVEVHKEQVKPDKKQQRCPPQRKHHKHHKHHKQHHKHHIYLLGHKRLL